MQLKVGQWAKTEKSGKNVNFYKYVKKREKTCKNVKKREKTCKDGKYNGKN